MPTTGPLNLERASKPWRPGSVWVLLLSGIMLLAAGCGHRGPWDINEYIQHLERPERAVYQKPDDVIQALDVQPGMVIADIGAGSGYFTRRFARAVGPEGIVMAVDTDSRMLAYNREQLTHFGNPSQVQFILAKPDDPSLPAGQVDLIFLCNVYHHLESRIDYLEKTKVALAPRGRLVIIDFYHDERSGNLGFSKHHLVPRQTVIREVERAGFGLVKEYPLLSRQYFLEFSP